ncbi:ABC transporter substrate-binding protein (plasmid) [Haloferacaceae archaeon DSL9]
MSVSSRGADTKSPPDRDVYKTVHKNTGRWLQYTPCLLPIVKLMMMCSSSNGMTSIDDVINRRDALRVAGVGGIFALAGCTGGGDGDEDGGGGEDVEVDDTVFVEGIEGPSTLDLHQATRVPESMVLNSIHEPLFAITPDLEPVPRLASEYEENDESTEFTVALRDGITFHDGSDLTAEAVVGSFDRLLEISPQDWRVGPVDSVEATGDNEVTFSYEEPYPLFPYYMADSYTGIVSMSAVEEAGDQYGQETVVGSGPLQFEEWARDEEIILSRYDDYDWGPGFLTNQGPANFEEFRFRIIPEATTLFNELTVGNVHGTTYLSTSDVENAEEHENTQITRVEDPHPSFVSINVQESPTDEVAVRQAINHAINKDAVINAGLNGEGYPLWNLAPPSGEGALDEETARDLGYEYDPERARELLDEAGWTNDGEGQVRERDGEPLELTFFAFTIDRYNNMGQVIQAMLAEVGFDAQLEVLEPGTLYDRAEGSEHNLLTMSYSGGYLAVVTLEAILLSENTAVDGGSNYSLWENGEFDELILTAKHDPDEQARTEALTAAQELALEEAPVVPLAGYTKFYGHKNEVDVGTWFDHPWWPSEHYIHRLEVNVE